MFTGLLPVAQNDDQLATVMSHEIAHALAHHASERIARQQMYQQALDALNGAMGTLDPEQRHRLIGLLAAGAQTRTLAYDRQQESEADHVGLILMAKAGYDPRVALDVWERMARKEKGAPPAFLSTHPGYETRVQQLHAFMPVDNMVNRVFNALRERDEARRTLVVFTSDNGYQWGEHGLTRKGTPYPASFWVPLLIRWPGHFAQSGRALSRPAANVDIAPTLLDAAGVTPNPTIPMDGHSLLTPWTRKELLLEFWQGGGDAPPWASIRTGRYQYTEYYRSDGTVSFREYYRAGDTYQLRNLLHDGVPANDPNVPALEARLAAARACEGGACP